MNKVLDLVWENISLPLLENLGVSTKKPFVAYVNYAVIAFIVITVLFAMNTLVSAVISHEDDDGKKSKKVGGAAATGGSKKA